MSPVDAGPTEPSCALAGGSRPVSEVTRTVMRAVAGERLVHEVEAVVHRLAGRPEREGGQAGRSGTGRAALGLAGALAPPAGEQPEARHREDPDDRPMIQPRTVRNFVHSACSNCPNPSRPELSPDR